MKPNINELPYRKIKEFEGKSLRLMFVKSRRSDCWLLKRAREYSQRERDIVRVTFVFKEDKGARSVFIGAKKRPEQGDMLDLSVMGRTFFKHIKLREDEDLNELIGRVLVLYERNKED